METVCLVLTTLLLRLKGHGLPLCRCRRLGDSGTHHRQRWRAKHLFGLSSVEDAFTGTVTVIQRFDSALRLNVYLHMPQQPRPRLATLVAGIYFFWLLEKLSKKATDIYSLTSGRSTKDTVKPGTRVAVFKAGPAGAMFGVEGVFQ